MRTGHKFSAVRIFYYDEYHKFANRRARRCFERVVRRIA